jgi:hypothetical protein
MSRMEILEHSPAWLKLCMQAAERRRAAAALTAFFVNNAAFCGDKTNMNKLTSTLSKEANGY